MKNFLKRKNITAVVFFVFALLSAVLFLQGDTRADRNITPFTRADQRLLHGGFKIIGNSIMTCDEDAVSTNPLHTIHPDECVDARNFEGSTTSGGQRNNGQYMKYIDVDGDSSTFNSSSANLSVPSGSTIRHARLFWAQRDTVIDPDAVVPTMRFKKDGGSYQTITSTATQRDAPNDGSVGHIQYSADVTNYVRQNGSGRYFGANIPANVVGIDKSGGWALYVVYENSSDPLRLITLFDGNVFEEGNNFTGTGVTVSGFQPNATSGTPGNLKLGMQVWDGDRGPAQPDRTPNDNIKINGQVVDFTSGNSGRSQTDAFVSEITDENNNTIVSPDRNPGYRNTFGQDILSFDGTGLVSHNTDSLTIDVTAEVATDDLFWLDFVAVQVDVIEPEVEITKKATSTNNPATPGSQVDYEITMTTRNAPITNARIEDAIPLGVTYVPESLEITQDDANTSNVGEKTDQLADDTGEITVSGNKKVIFRVGDGANAQHGGTLDPGQVVKVKFSVLLEADPDDAEQRCPANLNESYFNGGNGDGSNGIDIDKKAETIDNQALGYYQGGSIEAPFDYTGSPAATNVVHTPVECLPGVADTGASMNNSTPLLVTGAGGAGIMGFAIKRRGFKSVFRSIFVR
jgi:uncharacterized repeat protein (TIGR01451 family)